MFFFNKKKEKIDLSDFDGVNIFNTSNLNCLRQIIVCGIPRSGTTMTMEILNKFRERCKIS